MDILVKVSGDLENSEKFYEWLSSICKPEDKLFVLCGGGTLITQALERRDIPFKFGPGGREIESLEGRLLAQQVLEEAMLLTIKNLEKRGIKAVVDIPVKEIGGKICHMNGDSYALALSANFDKIYMVTLEGRVKNLPKEFNKIEVVYL